MGASAWDYTVPYQDDLVGEFEQWRWYGRCAVLHDERGEPREIRFWGSSGD